MESAQQEIFTLCRQAAISVLGEGHVYDDLPDARAQYPFFYIGENFDSSASIKSVRAGRCVQRIHIFHNDMRKRGTTSGLMQNLLVKLYNARNTRNFQVSLFRHNAQMVTDKTTATVLLHGVLELEWRYY